MTCPPKCDQYAHNVRYAHYVQEGCITLTQKALVRPQDPHLQIDGQPFLSLI